jgi:hypothetical protein
MKKHINRIMSNMIRFNVRGTTIEVSECVIRNSAINSILKDMIEESTNADELIPIDDDPIHFQYILRCHELGMMPDHRYYCLEPAKNTYTQEEFTNYFTRCFVNDEGYYEMPKYGFFNEFNLSKPNNFFSYDGLFETSRVFGSIGDTKTSNMNELIQISNNGGMHSSS